MRTARFEPVGPLQGRYVPPADKSISHRAAIFAAMADGAVEVSNYLDAADTRSTLTAVAAAGAEIADHGGGSLTVTGAGLRRARQTAIDVGNSGTLLRLLPGWLAGQPGGRWTLDGDESIRRRPVDRVAAPLRLMGADIAAREDRLTPMQVTGTELEGIDYSLPVPSAQVKSCVLIAGLLAGGVTAVTESEASRDHTERLFARAGVPVQRSGLTTRVRACDRFEPGSIEVPGDPSSAAFFVTAAALVPGSRIEIEGVGLNWTRTGFLRIAQRMGVAIEGELEDAGTVSDREPIGTLAVSHGPLRATMVEGEEVPLAIDELTLVALLAAHAEGETVVRGAQELRHKESDRIAGVVAAMRGMGADIEETPDGFAVRGDAEGRLPGGTVDALGDHRLAMLGAVAGIASSGGVDVIGMESAAISYPGFEADLAALLSR